MAGDLSTGAVVGITIASAVGGVLLVISCLCLLRCCLRRRRAAQLRHLDLEQPFDVEGGRMSGKMPTIKESELVTSPNVVIAQLDDADKLVMNGLPVAGNQSPTKLMQQQQVARSASADTRLQHTGSSNAIMRWLESAELASPRGSPAGATSPGLQHSASSRTDPGGSLKSPSPVRSLISGKLSNLSIKNITGKLDTAELQDMRRRLLAAATGGYAGDSSSLPVDVKGVVFNRLPPSRRASPAPSTVDGSTISRARGSRRSEAGGELRVAAGEMAPEEQLTNPPSLARSSRELTRVSSGGGGVPTSSAGGLAFARIDSFSRSRTLPRKLDVSDGGAGPGEPSPGQDGTPLSGLPPRPGSRNRSQSGTFPRAGGTPASAGKQMSYADAMAALEQATQPVPSSHGSPALPVSIPAGGLPSPQYSQPSHMTSPGAGSSSGRPAMSPRTPTSHPQ